MENLITWFFWKRYLIRKVICENISKKDLRKNFEDLFLNLLFFLFLIEKEFQSFFNKESCMAANFIWLQKPSRAIL